MPKVKCRWCGQDMGAPKKEDGVLARFECACGALALVTSSSFQGSDYVWTVQTMMEIPPQKKEVK